MARYKLVLALAILGCVQVHAQMTMGTAGGFKPALTTVTFSATPTFTRTAPIQEFQMTLTGNVTSSTLSGAVAGDILIFNFCQDGTGGRTVVFPTGFSQAAIPDPTASVCTKQTFYWDGAAAIAISNGITTGTSVTTATNCSSAASPAVCADAAAGSVTIAAAATTVVVNTTVVTANSQIFLMYDSSLGAKLGVTCNATEPALYGITARTAATSFTITATAPITNPACFSYFVVN